MKRFYVSSNRQRKLMRYIGMGIGLFVVSGMLFTWYLTCYKRHSLYGFHSSDGRYLYSYFMTDADLVVKNRADFERQFTTQAYQELMVTLQQNETDSGIYLQPESFFLPIIQRIVAGTKSVFIFEKHTDSFDGSSTKRIAFECEGLKETLAFPEDCHGYYMIAAWEWPPLFAEIQKGSIKFDSTSLSKLPTGCLSGYINISMYDDFVEQKHHLSIVVWNFRTGV